MGQPPEFGWGRLPGELLKHCPTDERGEYVPPKYLTHCRSTDMEDEFLINMLEAYGIPVMRQRPGDGTFGKVLLGMSGTGTDLYVPETMYDEARDLMEAKSEEEDYDDVSDGI